MGAAGGAAAALHEGPLLVSQPTRQSSESLTNIGTATLLSSAMAQEGFREPSGLVPELRASWTRRGRKPLYGARAMKQEGKGPLAVFWMANPENLISVPLAALRCLMPVVGTLRDRGYELLGEWVFSDDQAEFVALAMRCLVGQPLLALKFANCLAG
jgi:hypothetical protein